MSWQFVKDKIILRSAVASIVPIAGYSIGFGAAQLAGIKTGLFFAANPWIAIGVVSVVYPINRVPLWILFESVDAILTRKLRNDDRKPEDNPILKGDFLPCQNEDAYQIHDIISGKVPTDINGVYLRNGPNIKYMPKSERVHWFDGDGMIHAFRIKDGKIFYCNRYTQTPRLQQEMKYGKAIYPRIGELFSMPGFLKMGLYEL